MSAPRVRAPKPPTWFACLAVDEAHLFAGRRRGAKAPCGFVRWDQRYDVPVADRPQCPRCRATIAAASPTPARAAVPARSGAPRAARTVNRGRIYTVNGQSLWSVTTILGNGLPKPAIAAWQSRTIAEFAVANWRQIGAMVSTVRLRPTVEGYHIVTDPDAVAGAVDWLKGAPWRESARKMDVGSAVHAEAEAIQLGTPRPEPPLTVARYIESFRHFLADFEPEIELTEATVYNLRESYAGTLDTIMTFRLGELRRRLLGDVKTGKDIYPDVALQLAAYEHAEAILLDDGTSVAMPEVDGAFALHLREYDPALPEDRGYSVVPVATGQAAWDAFRYCREVMRWMEETSKGVLSQPITNPAALSFLFPAAQPEAVAS